MRPPAAEVLAAWRADPVKFVRDVFGQTPDPWQAAVLRSFPNENRLAMKACVGPGKTWLLAQAILNFLTTRPHPRVACVSITWQNLQNNLWAELAKWIGRSALLDSLFVWTHTKVFARHSPGTWWATARSWQRSANPDVQGDTLAGLHENYAMIVADESGGIPSAVMASAEGVLASGIETKLIQAGNPTHLSGPLYDACTKDRDIWFVVEISGDPKLETRAPRVALAWALEMIRKYGYDSNIVRVRVRGLFPHEASDALISLSMLEDAYAQYQAGAPVDEEGEPLRRGKKALGVDVARYGDDDTVVTKRDGDFIEGVEHWGGKNLMVTADEVHRIALEWGAEAVAIDDVGLGGGVTDNLELRPDREYEIIPVNVGRAADELGADGEHVFANLKAELSMKARERFRRGRIALSPDFKDTSLDGEATDIRYRFGRGGKVIQIESKDDYKKRHDGQSSDYWDSLLLATEGVDMGTDIDVGGW